jgi:hypothetical protein
MSSGGISPVSPPRHYRFAECTGRGLFGEVWRALDPAGKTVSVQMIGILGAQTEWTDRDQDRVARLAQVSHEALLPVEGVQCEPQRLLLFMPFVNYSLWDHFATYRLRALPGVPRRELLSLLRTVALALDTLQQRYALHHLAVSAHCVWLSEERAAVSDYGLVENVWLPAGAALRDLPAPYAPPEFRENRSSPTSDQFSLACLYYHMLTGRLPFGKAAGPGGQKKPPDPDPDLEPLPTTDRSAVARALDFDPARRFPSCIAFFDSLRGTVAPTVAPLVLHGYSTAPHPEELVQALVGQAKGKNKSVAGVLGAHCWFAAEGALEHKCAAWLPPSVSKMKLQGFAAEWKGQEVQLDDQHFSCVVNLHRTFWQWFQLENPRLQVEVKMTSPQLESDLRQVHIRIRYLGRNQAYGRTTLEHVGTLLVDSLRNYLVALPEHRAQRRYAFPHPLRIAPISPAWTPGETLDCMGVDISLGGLGLQTSYQVPTSQIYIYFDLLLEKSGAAATVALPAAVRLIKPTGDGGFQLGTRFLLVRASEH